MAKIPKRECACGCEKWFTPKVDRQLYLNLRHKNRAGQARFRQEIKRLKLAAARSGD